MEVMLGAPQLGLAIANVGRCEPPEALERTRAVVALGFIGRDVEVLVHRHWEWP
jgi:hypothetical protein